MSTGLTHQEKRRMLGAVHPAGTITAFHHGGHVRLRTPAGGHVIVPFADLTKES